LIVKTIKVDSGAILYRRMPAAHGSAHPIRKRTSAIFVELGEGKAKKAKRVNTEVAVSSAKKAITNKKPRTPKAN